MSQFSRDINAIGHYLRERRRDYMEPLGLKGIHARMIMLICENPGCSQERLSRKMGFDKSTIARQVELLEDKGFVERRPSEKDKRVLCVYPTEKMEAFYPGLRDSMDAWDNELLQELTVEERQQLTVIMEKIREKIGREVKK